jgi:lactoylglutathione lyase
MKLGHIAIRVKDINKSLEFYCNGLGFREAFRIMNDDGSLRIVYVHIEDNQYLELCLGGNNIFHFDDKTSIGIRHICFVVDNLEKTKADIESKGIVFDSEILHMRDNNLSAYLFDPDGNKLELVEIKEDSPQYEFESALKD